MPTPEVAAKIVALVDGRQAVIQMPAVIKDFPARVRLEIIPAAGQAGYVLIDRWLYGSVQARNQARAEGNLHPTDIDAIMLALRDWVAQATRALEAALAPPDENAPSAPYGIIRRALNQSTGQAFSYDTVGVPNEVVRILTSSRDLAPDTLIEWPKDQIERLVMLDLDFHNAAVPKPAETEIDAIGYNLAPAPWCWWRTQGGGLHALYAQAPNSPFTAVELASGAVAQLLTDPTIVRCKGTVELLTRSRHPLALQKGKPCGPVHEAMPTDDFVCLAAFSAAGATDAEIEEVLEENGLTIGQRLSHDMCLIDPGHASQAQHPVVVCDTGIYCHSCAGRLGNGWTSWAAVRAKHGMESTQGNDAEPIMQAVRHFVQFSHVNYLIEAIAPHIPVVCRKPLYSALLKKHHRAAVPIDPRIGMATSDFFFVRGMSGWLHEASLGPVRPGLKKDDINVLASVCSLDSEGMPEPRPKDLTIMTRDGRAKGWHPIIADSFSPFYAIHNRVQQNRRRASGVICTAWDARQSDAVVKYRPQDRRISMELAEQRIGDYFPGISFKYLKALMIAVGCADSNQGMVPMLWVTGETGSAKTTTTRIIGEMFGEAHHNLSGAREERLDQQFGEKLSKTRMILFDDCAKDATTYNTLHTFILRITREHTFYLNYVGDTEVPVRSAIVMTDKRTPAYFFDSSQFGRRVHVIQLEGTTPKWDAMDRRVEGWWQRTQDLTDAAESYFSHIVDEYFPEGDRESFSQKMTRVGVSLMADSHRDDNDDTIRRERTVNIALAICEAPNLPAGDERRLGRGMKEVVFSSGTALGRLCLDLIESQGDVQVDYEHLLHGLESSEGYMKEVLGLVSLAKFHTKQHGKRIYIRLVEIGHGSQSSSKRVNQELFPTYPPTIPPGGSGATLASGSPTQEASTPALPRLPGMLATDPASATQGIPTLNTEDEEPFNSLEARYFRHDESGSYVVIEPEDFAAFEGSVEGALCTEIEGHEYDAVMNRTVQLLADNMATRVDAICVGHVPQAPTGELTVYLDFETQSACNLKKHGSYVYAEHPTTKVICAAIRVGDRRIFWTLDLYNIRMPPGVEYEHGIQFLYDMVTAQPIALVIHNENFEQAIWEYTLKLPEPAAWYDTQHVTLMRGLPAGADEAGLYLLGMGKDIDGYKLMMKTCKPTKKGEMPSLTDNVLQRYIDYNFRDTDIQVGIASKFGLGIEPPEEFRLNRLHMAINRYGLRLDRVFAERLRGFDEFFKARACEHVEAITQDSSAGPLVRTDLTRNDYLRAWVAKYGLNLDNMRADTIEKLVEAWENNEPGTEHIPPILIDVLTSRMVVTRAAMSKVETGLRCASADDRMRGLFRYWGAHTGRWSGNLIQPQNFKRPDEDFDLVAAITAIERNDIDGFKALCADKPPYELLGSLIRGMIVPAPGHTFCIGDFSSVEARGLQWLAGDQAALQEHIDFDTGRGPNVYCAFAGSLYGRPIDKKKKEDAKPYQAGKIGQLACGYAGGPGAVARFAYTYDIDMLRDAGVTEQQVVDAWRARYTLAVRLWRDYEWAARSALMKPGRAIEAGKCVFRVLDGNLEVLLPNGRKLTYHNARLEGSSRQGWEDSLVIVYYTAVKGKTRRVETYGGKLTENITQAICRDLLGYLMLGVADEGFAIPLHVHDECVAEPEESRADNCRVVMKQLMNSTPSWAHGFPLSGTPGFANRYGK